MAARPVFAVLDNVPLPAPSLATLRRAEQSLPATTACPPTADELAKARQVASEYRRIADVHNPVSPEFEQNAAAAKLYATAVQNLAAAQYFTPTPGEGHVAVPTPAQPGPTYLAMQAAGIGGAFLILASALDGVKDDVQGVKDDVKTIKRDIELVKRRQQDLRTGVLSLKARAVKTGNRVKSVKERMDRLSNTYYVSEAQRQRKLNASLRSTRGAELSVVTGPAGTAPPLAITTLAQVDTLDDQQLDQLLQFYRLGAARSAATKKKHIKAFICGETLATQASPYPQVELEAEAEGLWDSDAEEEEDDALWDDEEQERLRRAADEAAAAGEGVGGNA
ncbi:hypothetical protein Rt10032_c10g4111 [Rhodotorula toruloides]|uniref:Mug135-like C-terminal domain-containing protein n=1 Tax=Rhodotorula toruloides TaxID=5286 RepID=A0A511KKW2_RHOTO|nr:hypothetical protein Rt10032_c10g4109 [Rhodotorula toruloides]GEM10094.1 hypothetical protein Rt10032_c10g4111 [Rhodotorula toruloides]